MDTWRTNIADMMRAIESKGGKPYTEPITHATMRLGLYAPRGHDPQKPHSQDEIYIIAAGEGRFVRGEARVAFAPGDAFFVPAGMEHRFEDITDDFAAWVVFWGPEGGET